ncbi:MAG: TIGR02147 family protein [Proteobacteria bacterium]|nr:MAG: TIGR02147 family protein [Pseudomonadota bacterium]
MQTQFDRPLAVNAVDYLKVELQSRRDRRSEYSLRAFARDLNLSPSTLSEILNEKVGLSPLKGKEVARRLKLPSAHSDHFCDLLAAKSSRSASQRKEAQIRATARLRSTNAHQSIEKFKLISDWQHNAILELVDLNPKYHSLEAISKALGITKKLARESVERLSQLGELTIGVEGWKTASAVTFVGEQIPSEAIRSYHVQILKKALEALQTQSVDEREFQSSFFAIDTADLKSLKEDISKMRREIMKKYGHKPTKNKVYSLSLQLIRLSEEIS